jgi:hypothetical protein
VYVILIHYHASSARVDAFKRIGSCVGSSHDAEYRIATPKGFVSIYRWPGQTGRRRGRGGDRRLDRMPPTFGF